MATIRQVAARAGVSTATVSAVINNTKRITPPVRRRVEEAMAELDYRPNALARSLYKGKTNTIAFLVPSVAHPAFSSCLLTVEEHANRRGVAVFIANTRGSSDLVEQYCNRLLDMRVDGVLMSLTWDLARKELVERFGRHNIPVVGFYGARTMPAIDCFVVDEHQAGYDLGRYLCGLGHTRCAFLGPRDSAVAKLRLDGLTEAYASLGQEFSTDLVTWMDSYDESGGRNAAQRLLARGERFTCVIAFNDFAAASILTVLQGHGLSVPEHVSLATFGDHYAHLTSPQLTTMAHSDSEVGKMAVQKLLDIIDGAVQPEPTVHSIPKQLLIRDSCVATLQ